MQLSLLFYIPIAIVIVVGTAWIAREAWRSELDRRDDRMAAAAQELVSSGDEGGPEED